MPKPPETLCPRCHTVSPRLEVLSRRFVRENYFRCPSCHHVWTAQKTLLEQRNDERRSSVWQS